MLSIVGSLTGMLIDYLVNIGMACKLNFTLKLDSYREIVIQRWFHNLVSVILCFRYNFFNYSWILLKGIYGLWDSIDQNHATRSSNEGCFLYEDVFCKSDWTYGYNVIWPLSWQKRIFCSFVCHYCRKPSISRSL